MDRASLIFNTGGPSASVDSFGEQSDGDEGDPVRSGTANVPPLTITFVVLVAKGKQLLVPFFSRFDDIIQHVSWLLLAKLFLS